jgi:LytS/YehU family sensor histidine kinase
LLKARFGDGLELNVDIDGHDKQKLLPPLTLQVIVENTFSHNAVSKSQPLNIHISSEKTGSIKVIHNVQPRLITTALDTDAALDNLVSKYELLSPERVRITETATSREILLPLLFHKQKEEVPA